MVGWTCHKCNGTGKEIEIVIRGNDVQKREVSCSECRGKGHIDTN